MDSTMKLSIILVLAALAISSASFAHGGGFSIDLIHRDSPRSPLYDPSQTDYDRLQNAIARSTNRVNHFTHSVSTNEAIEPTIVPVHGEYLLNYSLGTPATKFFGIADTGSDLIWTQCQPCDVCFKQKGIIFDPRASSTYRNVSCSSQSCADLSTSGVGGCRSDNRCHFEYTYGDGSHTNGIIGAETVTFESTSGKPVEITNVTIGCGYNNDITFSEFSEDASGIVGLGRGPLSLVSQLGSSIDRKFSYCLVPASELSQMSSSKLNFGSAAEISGEGVLTTPLVLKTDGIVTLYYLTLEGFSVGDGENSSRINIVKPLESGATDKGNIIIDSGTTLTFLAPDLYPQLEDKVKAAVKAEQVEAPLGLGLCYKYSSEIDLPTITVHFTGADLKLNTENTFVRVSNEVLCMVFAPGEQLSIYGNLMQMNWLVEYDFGNEKVKFKKTTCLQA